MPVTLAELATITHRDEVLAKLDAKQRDLLVAADAAYAAALADEKKWPAARAAYEGALTGQGVGDLEGYARFRLARILSFQKDPSAVTELERVIALGRGPAQAARALAERARIELVSIHARTLDADQAYARLRGLSAPGEAGEPAALTLLAEVAREAARVGEHARAEALFGDLLARAGGSAAGCGYAVGQIAARLARKEDPKSEFESLQKLVVVAREFEKSSQSADIKRECMTAVVGLATDVAARWHIQAVGARGERGTSDPRSLRLATDLYELVLDSVPPAALDAMARSGPESARPTALRLRRAMADLYYYQLDWKRAAAAYDEVISLAPEAADATEVAYRAASTLLRATYEGHEDSSPRVEPGPATDPTPEEVARVEADNRLICLGEPPRSARALYDDWVDAKLDRGLVNAAHRRWSAAAADLREVAFHHPDHAGSERAGLLYLQMIELAAATDPTCADELSTAAPALFALECAASDPPHADWRKEGVVLWNTDHAETCEAIRALAPAVIPPAIHPELPPLPPAAPAPRSTSGCSTSVSGQIPIEALENIIQQSLGGALGCYESALRADPELEGQLRAKLVIGRDGAVTTVEIRASSALESSKVASCVTRWFYGLAFPQPEGGLVTLDYPLGFTRTALIPPQPENAPTMKLSLPE